MTWMVFPLNSTGICPIEYSASGKTGGWEAVADLGGGGGAGRTRRKPPYFGQIFDFFNVKFSAKMRRKKNVNSPLLKIPGSATGKVCEWGELRGRGFRGS